MMMEIFANIHRPTEFINAIHPENYPGSIVISREIGKTNYQSEASLSQLQKLSHYAWKLPEVRVSPSSFRGSPLLLNFEATNVIYFRVMATDELTYQRVAHKIYELGLGKPSWDIQDGESFYFFFRMEEPILREDFYRLYILQQGLLNAFSDFNLDSTSLDYAARIPLVGNLHHGNLVTVTRCYGKVFSQERLEYVLLRGQPPAQLFKFGEMAATAMELHRLFCSRVFLSDEPRQFHAWINSFAVLYASFCTPKALKRELTALAESLLGRKWSAIEAGAREVVIKALHDALDLSYITIGERPYHTGDLNWAKNLAPELQITAHELSDLGLKKIVDTPLFGTSFGSFTNRSYGANDFMPLEQLVSTNLRRV